MKSSHRSILSKLDDAVRWTGMPDNVAEDMSGDRSVDRDHRPLRWSPLLLIAFSCVLLILCLLFPPQISAGAVIGIMTGMVLSIVTGGVLVYTNGPLGKPAAEDDEREAALRKDSFLFCLGLLAALNGLGQPVLLILSQWQNWQATQSAVVVFGALMLNATLLGVC